MSTVSGSIANLYSTNYKVPNPLFIPNTPIYSALNPKINKSKKIKLVFHGYASKDGDIEILIESVREVQNRFELHLILTGDRSIIKNLCKKYNTFKFIFFHTPVLTEQIVQYLYKYDLGIYSLQPKSQNDYLALPNKFFEFIQARLGVIIGPSPEMAEYVNRYKIGRVAKGFTKEDLVEVLLTLNDDNVRAFKEASHTAASHLCWEAFVLDFRLEIEKLLKL